MWRQDLLTLSCRRRGFDLRKHYCIKSQSGENKLCGLATFMPQREAIRDTGQAGTQRAAEHESITFLPSLSKPRNHLKAEGETHACPQRFFFAPMCKHVVGDCVPSIVNADKEQG